MFPLSVSNPALVLMRLPLEFNAPAKLPLPKVNAVPSSATTPEPSNVASSTALLNNFTAPFAVNVLATGKAEPLTLFNVAPEATVSTSLVNVPDNVSVPLLTDVAPV